MEFVCPHVACTVSWCVILVVVLAPASPFVVNRDLTTIMNGVFGEIPFILK